MPAYRAPVDNVVFLLADVLGFHRHANLPGFEDATPETVAAVLEAGARVAEDVLAPLNRVGDVEGCRLADDGSVTTPPGFAAAYRAFAGGGWIGLAGDPAHGGQGLPYVLAAAVNEFVTSANMAFGMYPGLTQGAIAALTLHGSDDQKRTYLPKLMSGAWAGTMNLTEPQAGTDLGLLRTRAAENPDGSFAITGTKIFISSGEHDLTGNIVHLVLARIDGAPAGTKGLSLFVVPKFLPDGDGVGARNALACVGLETKMGIHGNATCTMSYDGATGWLVGERDKGLRAMFTMMNEARLGVGIQGLAMSEAAYQAAAAYARERRQGRALAAPRDPEAPADPILVHPDIRRTLAAIKGFNIAARALVLSVALDADIALRSPDAAMREAADDRLGLLTPVVKGVLTDRGFANAVEAQQVFGGAGYIADTGIEQIVRDARIAMIYEGANGIQALDLVGRKLPRDGGRAITAFFAEVGDFVSAHGNDPAMAPFVTPLKRGLDDLQGATVWFMANAFAKPDNGAAGATDYLHLLGLVALGLMWGRIAAATLARGDAATDVARGDLAFGRVFMERTMPETGLRLSRIQAGAGTLMAIPDGAF
jgi:acyl-CoA dehydrogenase